MSKSDQFIDRCPDVHNVSGGSLSREPLRLQKAAAKAGTCPAMVQSPLVLSAVPFMLSYPVSRRCLISAKSAHTARLSTSYFLGNFSASVSRTRHSSAWPYIYRTTPSPNMAPNLDSYFKTVDGLADHFIERLRKAVAIPSVSAEEERRPDVVKVRGAQSKDN